MKRSWSLFRARPLSFCCCVFLVCLLQGCGNQFAFENSLSSRLLELIRKHSAGRPVLVFVSTRVGTVKAARGIVASLQKYGLMESFVEDNGQQERSQQRARPKRKSREEQCSVLKGAQRVFVLSLSLAFSLEEAALQFPRDAAEAIRAGIGVHHGGMSPQERHIIEKLFIEGDLKVVWFVVEQLRGGGAPI